MTWRAICAKPLVFGIARVLKGGNDVASTYCGTPVYMSPEIINNKKYTHEVDVWALGCVVGLARRVIDTHFEPSFHESDGIL